jgi:hypothetical protein
VAQSHAFSSGRSPKASATAENRRTPKDGRCGDARDLVDKLESTADDMVVFDFEAIPCGAASG